MLDIELSGTDDAFFDRTKGVLYMNCKSPLLFLLAEGFLQYHSTSHFDIFKNYPPHILLG